MKEVGEDVVKVLESGFARWLSIDNSTSSLFRCLPSVLVYLDRNKSVDANTSGLFHNIVSFDFVALLFLARDVFPPLAILSKKLQAVDIDFASVESGVSVVLSEITSMIDSPGPNFLNISAAFKNLEDRLCVCFVTSRSVF